MTFDGPTTTTTMEATPDDWTGDGCSDGRLRSLLCFVQLLLAVPRNHSLAANATANEEPPKNWHSLLLLFVVAAGVGGNLLVCIAVSVEKKLQNIANYFLVSLAIADLFVSLVVMPCSFVQEFMGYWPFDLVMCDIWQVLDVTMCTSSIMHMCAISMDRYVGIRHPLRTRVKTCRSAGVKMAAVWCISLAIASPIVLLSVLQSTDVLDAGRYPLCAVLNTYFLSYGSLTAFFVPLLIMLVAYSLTIQLLSRQCRLSRDAAAYDGIRRTLTQPGSCRGSPSPQARSRYGNNGAGTVAHRQSQTNGGGATDDAPAAPDTTRTALINPLHLLGLSTTLAASVNGTAAAHHGEAGEGHTLHDVVKRQSALIRAAGTMHQKQDTWLRRANTVRTEQKAVKVLGTMFALFVICWLPFFALNFAMGVCESCHLQIHPQIFKICLWLGYMSSTLNPIIYTVFNRNFRSTFARLICCTYWGSQRRRLRRRCGRQRPLLAAANWHDPQREQFDKLNESNV